MTCYLYNISVDSRVLHKVDAETPYSIAKTAVRPTDAVDIISPSFTFDYSAAALSANYLYCVDFQRYYFINNVAVDTAGRINIKCTVDVLQTYETEIKNSVATVLRTESIGHPTKYIDSELPVYASKKNVTSIVMPQIDVPLNSKLDTHAEDCYLLTVIGGNPNI